MRSGLIDLSEAAKAPSLFVSALVTWDDDDRLTERRPYLSTTGFAPDWDGVLQGRPEKFGKLDESTVAGFVRFWQDDRVDRLAAVSVEEAYVYDLRYKAELDVSGVFITIAWRPDSVVPIEEFLDAHCRPSLGGSAVDCMVRLPLRREFVFPEPRGVENPYDGYREHKIKLQDIAAFEVDWVEIGIRKDRGATIDWPVTPLKNVLAQPTILRLIR